MATTARRQQATTPDADARDQNINDYLNEMNSGGGMTDKPEVEAGDNGDQNDGTSLPTKKKKKSRKTDKRRRKSPRGRNRIQHLRRRRERG